MIRLKHWWNKRRGFPNVMCEARWWCLRPQLRALWPYWAARSGNYGRSCRVHALDPQAKP